MDFDDNNSSFKPSLLTTLHSLFSLSTVKRQLMAIHGDSITDEEERWAEDAVEVLARKLRWKPTSLGEIQRVLVDPSARPGKCVTIPRGTDGRLVVYQRKSLPHVTYCKLWRWPDLRSQHELVELSCCKYPFRPNNKDNELVCVNPYHYRRKDAPEVEEVRIDRQRNYHEQPQESCELTAGHEVNNDSLDLDDILDYLQEAIKPPEHQAAVESPAYQAAAESPEYQASVESPEYQASVESPEHQPAVESFEHQAAVESFEHQAMVTAQQYQPQPVQNLNYSPALVEFTSASTIRYHPHPIQEQNHSPEPITDSEAIPYLEMSSWATIAYYELNKRVGQLFQCSQTIVRVDGYTSPGEVDRFCLGSLVACDRNSVIENVRQHIGDGVMLHYAGGELYVECISKKPIFVQSMLYNCQNGRNPIGVVKLEPGQSLRIFHTTYFGNLLQRMVEQGFAATYKLITMCSIRMSFVKGWGNGYFRTDVTSTPCWIEITLNGPLKWLDNILSQMGSPPNAISSVS